MPNEVRTETITTNEGERYEGQLVWPGCDGRPGVLLLQEIFGVNDFLLGKADDLADLGYAVLCPDVFWRVEPGVSLPHDDDGLARAMGYVERFAGIDPDTTGGDLLAALARLRELPECAGRVAAMGYCLGGRLAYETAVLGDPDACVSYYGSGVADRLDVADRLTCPTLFHFGSQDPYIPEEQVAAIKQRFSGRDDVEVHAQPGAGHAFENLLAPAFGNAAAAAESWPVTVAFLARTLVGST